MKAVIESLRMSDSYSRSVILQIAIPQELPDCK